MDESKLIRAAQRGDVQAFNQLVLAYQKQVYHTAYRVLGDPEIAADATQEAFLAAFRGIRGFRHGSFPGWLMRIAVNCSYNQMRGSRRRPIASLDMLSVEMEPQAAAWQTQGEKSPEEHAEQKELGAIIQNGLQMLPNDQRLTVVLSDVDGFHYGEIAEITGTNVGTVKSRLARGRAQLREYLTKHQVLPAAKREPEARRLAGEKQFGSCLAS